MKGPKWKKKEGRFPFSLSLRVDFCRAFFSWTDFRPPLHTYKNGWTLDGAGICAGGLVVGFSRRPNGSGVWWRADRLCALSRGVALGIKTVSEFFSCGVIKRGLPDSPAFRAAGWKTPFRPGVQRWTDARV